MQKRTVYRVVYSPTYEGLADFFTVNKILPEDIIEIRKDSDYKAMYVKDVIDAE